MNNLSLTFAAQRQFDQAEQFLLRAIKIDENILEGKHPNLATDLVNLADLYRLKNLNEAAEKLYQRALLVLEKALGADNYLSANILEKMSSLYESTNRKMLAQRARARAAQIRMSSEPNTANRTIKPIKAAL